jgi:hypothetical protein
VLCLIGLSAWPNLISSRASSPAPSGFTQYAP